MSLSIEELATVPAISNLASEGATEVIGGVTVRHRFVSAPGAVGEVKWHFVEAGLPDAPTVLLVHGHPYSWFQWQAIIPRLSERYRVIAVDLKGYGQSDKSPGDYRASSVAEEFIAFCHAIDLGRFHLVASDRGATIMDYVAINHAERLISYARIDAAGVFELEADSQYEEWHREPLWAFNTLRDSGRYFAAMVYPLLTRDPAPELWQRLVGEFAFQDIAVAVPRYFQSSSFRLEQSDRQTRLAPILARISHVSIRGSQTRHISANVGDVEKIEILLHRGPTLLEESGALLARLEPFLAKAQENKPRETLSEAAPSPQWTPKPQKNASDYTLVKNFDGEVERLDVAAVTHRFKEIAVGPGRTVNWHFVEAGTPGRETVVMLHGHPESWYGYRHQIDRLAERFHIVAPDLKGYGQSDKRPGEWRHEYVAEELLLLLDALGIERFHLVAHDRGAVQADYIGGKHPGRVLSYVRMQQLGPIFIPMNSPQERLFRDPIDAPRVLTDPSAIFDRQWGRFKMRPKEELPLARMKSEVGHEGFGEAVARYFQSSSFQKEAYDRNTRLWPRMTFPVLLLQAGADVGQPKWYYEDEDHHALSILPNGHIEWVPQAGHFTTINHPDFLTDSIDRFVSKHAKA